MAGNTVQRIAFAVEEEALVGVDPVAAETEPAADAVQHRAVPEQLGGEGIEVGVLAAMPQMDLVHLQFGLVGGVGGLGSHVAVGVADGVPHSGAVGGTGEPALHRDLAADIGGQVQAAAAVIGKFKMGGGHAEDVHIPVEAAVEGEVGRLGINTVVGGVVHRDDQQVFVLQGAGELHPPGGVAAVVVGQLFTVQVDIRRGVGAVDLQEIGLRFGQVGALQRPHIDSGAAPVVVSAVLAVNVVPAVGQIDQVPVGGEGFGQRGPPCGKPICG